MNKGGLRNFMLAVLGVVGYGLFRILPLDWASALGSAIGRHIGMRMSVTRRARRNLARAFPEKSEAEREKIVRDMWDHLGRCLGEFSQIDRILKSDRVEIVGAEYLEQLRDDGKPGLIVSGHIGNWEVGANLPHQRYGLRLHFIFRAANNRWAKWLYERRTVEDAGEMIPKGSSGARRAVQLLKQGEHIGMLVDQKMNDGIPVPFFGRDAMTAPALAQFAYKFDCPILPARMERLGGARFRYTIFPPMDLPHSGDRHADILAAMTQVNATLESWIRERPDQWLWLHRRWPD
ncbi:lauroyl acyltransferase [Telmatospirillum sp. J64-1]|uniref:LpxL/LpxP family acyltransferase n=1 Tax=Telmatospirillum sp. J64-1 TaxID=2502183 RepID=UPI00115C76C8|nr:lauroyl acyltransferase [Telmatospirillum sp. J64-1]